MDKTKRVERFNDLLERFVNHGATELIKGDPDRPLKDSDIRLIRSNTDHYLGQLRESGLIRRAYVEHIKACKNGCCFDLFVKVKFERGADEDLVVLGFTKLENIKAIIKDLADFAEEPFGCEAVDMDEKIAGQKFRQN